MKRFLRYLFPICSLVIAGVWMVSVLYRFDINHRHLFDRRCSVASFGGNLYITQLQPASGDGWYHSFHALEPEGGVAWQLGLRLPFRGDFEDSYYLRIPYWLLFTPFFLLTLKLWYHPIKNWWRGTCKQGFAVELKEQSDKLA